MLGLTGEHCLLCRETSGGRGRTLADRWLEDPPLADPLRWNGRGGVYWCQDRNMVQKWWTWDCNLWRNMIWTESGSNEVKITEHWTSWNPKVIMAEVHLFQLFEQPHGNTQIGLRPIRTTMSAQGMGSSTTDFAQQNLGVWQKVYMDLYGLSTTL